MLSLLLSAFPFFHICPLPHLSYQSHLSTQLSHLSYHAHTCPPNSLTFHATQTPAHSTLSPFIPLTALPTQVSHLSHQPTQLSHLSHSIHTPANPPFSILYFTMHTPAHKTFSPFIHHSHTCPPIPQSQTCQPTSLIFYTSQCTHPPTHLSHLSNHPGD